MMLRTATSTGCSRLGRDADLGGSDPYCKCDVAGARGSERRCIGRAGWRGRGGSAVVTRAELIIAYWPADMDHVLVGTVLY